MGKKKTKTESTQTTTAAPWAQSSIQSGLDNLNGAYQQSQAASAQTQPYLMQAIQGLSTGAPAYMQQAGQGLSSIIGGGSANPYTSQVAGYDASNPYTSQIAGQQFDAGSNQYIDQLASGKNEYIDQLLQNTSVHNPYAQQVADQIGQQTGSQLASSFGGAGRSGSGLASMLGAQGIGNALNSFWSGEYNNDQQLNATALTNAANLKQQGLTSAAGLQNSDLDRQLQAQQMQSQALQSAGSLSDAANGRGLSALLGAAGLNSDDANRQLAGINSASGLYGGSLQGIAPLLALSQQASGQGLQNASQYTNALQGLTLPYSTTNGTNVTKTTPGLYDWMQLFGQNAATAAKAAA